MQRPRHLTARARNLCARSRQRPWRGMAPEVLRKVFDPFFTTKGETGTGIGLPQVQALAQMVGGQVRIASERGIGTTVDLLFPSIQADT